MKLLKPGQILSLNNRLWNLRQVRSLDGRQLALEAVSASEASMGMVRQFQAVAYRTALFIAQPRGGYWQANLENDWQETGAGPVLVCTSATHLDLLDVHTRTPPLGKLPNNFSWSYSRAAKYRFCSRAYYYHYYAAWEGWQSFAPVPVQRAYLLKNLTNLSQWVGTLVHDSIKFALARLKSDQPVTADELVKQMHQRAQADFDASQRELYKQKPNQFTGFQEHYYDRAPDKPVWQAVWQTAEQYLMTFINSALYADLSQQPPETFLDVESLRSFLLGETTVWVQMDLVRFDSKAIYIYDWKTGEIDEAKLLTQLGVYGLFVRQAWPEWETYPLYGIVYNLATDALFEFELGTEFLGMARSSIAADIARLQSLLVDPQTNLAKIKNFPMIDELAICRKCQFRELCGREA